MRTMTASRRAPFASGMRLHSVAPVWLTSCASFPVSKGADTLLVNFREKVTESVQPAESAKDEGADKAPAEGPPDAQGPSEADFRFPVQNRFTGLIERIQNNPDFLEGYDLSDSFIAEDSEEGEDSEDETVYGGFFINKGAILKKPRSDTSPGPDKEKKRSRKGSYLAHS